MGTCPVSRRAATGKMNFGYTGTGNYLFRFKKFNGQKRDFPNVKNIEIGFSQKSTELLIYRIVLILKPEGLQDHRIKIHIGFYIKNSVGVHELLYWPKGILVPDINPGILENLCQFSLSTRAQYVEFHFIYDWS
jgi:hypothetical protein